MRLFYKPGSGRPFRVAWALEEIGVSYEAVPVRGDDPGFRALAPLGRVPALQWDDESVICDSSAILLALADRHPEAGLLGPLGSRERELALQYVMIAQTELEKAATNARRDYDVAQQSELFTAALEPFDAALDGHDALVADAFGVADIVFTGVLLIGTRCGFVAGDADVASPRILRYLADMRARPALAAGIARTESLFG